MVKRNPENPFARSSQSYYLYEVYTSPDAPTDAEILATLKDMFPGSFATRASLQTLKSQLRKGQFTAGRPVKIERQRRSKPVYASRGEEVES